MPDKKDKADAHANGNPIERMGLFAEPVFITTNDPFDPRKNGFVLRDRVKGRQFLTSPSKKGKTPETFLDKRYIHLFSGESYHDPVIRERRYRLKQLEKNVVPTPFKPSNCPQKPSGRGSQFGTFDSSYPLFPPTAPATEPLTRPNSKKEAELHNFYTNPPKKGSGYGYPGVTFGPKWEYLPSPYDRAHELKIKEHADHVKKLIGGKGFITTSHPQQVFDDKVFKYNPGSFAPPDKKKDRGGKLIPFKPSNPAKSGLGGCLNPYPQHENPKDLSVLSKKRIEAEVLLKSRDKTLAVFRPTGGERTMPVRSVVDMSVPLGPPSWIRAMQESEGIGAS